MPLKKLLNKIFELHAKKKIKKGISLAEKAGYFFVAGNLSKEQGRLNKAFELYKKGKEKKNYALREACLNNYDEIIRLLNLNLEESLTIRQIQKNEEIYNDRILKIYRERCDCGNWDKPRDSKVHNDLTISIKNYGKSN
ncbi:hypothetical protein HYS72_03325 [Candidatus Pacearchaeota archaeon]|nr:hypothetical protein [Candidatus Pacearchaeota archaeon]MBI2056887.1 hypothetical protein [Candidatus Pacearchaeota archaeon]